VQLVAEARVGAERCWRLGEDAEELGDGTAGGLDALDQGSAAVRCGELVVDVEAADFGLDCHLAALSAVTGTLLYFWPITYGS
jgi:hypothetical protein